MNQDFIKQVEDQVASIVCPYGPDQKTQIRAWRKGIADAVAAMVLVLESSQYEVNK